MSAKDLKKSKAELVQELTRLRTRLTRLEKRDAGTQAIRESLRETEAQYRHLIHNLPLGLFRTTPGPTGKFLMSNPALARMFGYGRVEDFLKCSVAELYQDPTARQQFSDKLLVEGKVSGEKLQLKRADGSTFFGAVSARVVKDESGKVAYFDGLIEDLTQQSEAGDRIRQSEEQFHTLFQTSRDAIMMLDERGFTDCNKATLELFGCSSKEAFITKHPSELSPPAQPDGTDSFNAAQQRIQTAFERGSLFFPWIHQRMDGTLFPAEVLLSRYFLRGEKMLQAVVRDITERQEAQKALKESERRLATLLANLPGMAYRGLNTRAWPMEFVSAGAQTLTGYAPADLVQGGRVRYGDLIHPEDRERVWEEVQQALAKQEAFRLEYRIQNAQGPWKWVWEQGQGILGEDGQLVALEGFISDISARKSAEWERQQALDIMQDVFYVYNQEEKFIRWNKRLSEVSGYSNDEIAKMSPLDFFFEADQARVRGAIGEVFRTGTVNRVEAPLKTKSGAGIPHEFTGSLLRDLQGNPLLSGTGRDISARKAVERELQKAKEDAEAANRAKSTFLANMSHELRTPLNAVIGYSEMLRDEAAEQKLDDFIPDLEKIYGAGKHLLALINDVLDLSKIEAGKVELFIEPFPLQPMIQEVLSTVHPLVMKNRNTLQSRLAPDLGDMAADLTRVRQILFNLISNAGKFTENGTITFAAARDTREGKDWIQFLVRDTGIGMSPEQQVRVFQGFTQADASTTKKYGGTGLGLPISQKFCQMMGGEISVESQLGQGATFTVRLPAQVEKAKPAREGATPLAATPPAAATAPGVLPHTPNTVVVIDDDPAVHDLLARYLKKEGFEIISAENGRKGIQLAKSAEPVAILLDVLMPGMDGWAVLRELKSDPQLTRIPVIMITIEEKQQLGFSLGASDYLIKPVDPDRLVATLGKYKREDVAGLVLVVEDDQPDRDLIVRTVKKQGWHVSEAENGRIALARVDEHLPDLIFLDLMMPEMDGFEFMRQLRLQKSCKFIPVVVVTAKDLTEAEQQQLRGNVQRIFRKGEYSRNQLLEVIREQLRGHASPRPSAGTEAEPE